MTHLGSLDQQNIEKGPLSRVVGITHFKKIVIVCTLVYELRFYHEA